MTVTTDTPSADEELTRHNVGNKVKFLRRFLYDSQDTKDFREIAKVETDLEELQHSCQRTFASDSKFRRGENEKMWSISLGAS